MRDPSKFPERLRDIRTTARLSQRELGERCGLHQAHIAHYEAGRRAPNLANLCAMADALNTSIDRLVTA